MDPFTLALATFGVQKLRGKSTKRALRDATIVGGGSYALGAAGMGPASFGQPAFSSLGMRGAQTYGQAQGLRTIPQSATFGKQFMKPEVVETIARSSPLSEAVVGGETAAKSGIGALLKKAKDNKLETALIASSVLPLLQEEEEFKPPFTEQDYTVALQEQAGKLRGGFEPVTNAMPARSEIYG